MKVKDLRDALDAALKDHLGEDAPLYLFINNELFDLRVDVFPKGTQGPGAILLGRGSRQYPGEE